jgi:hypothetical protein
LWPEIVRTQEFLQTPKEFVIVHDVDARRMFAALSQQRELDAAPQDRFDTLELSERVDEVLDSLPSRLARLLRLRFFEDRTQDEVAVEFKVTRERIRQLEAKGLRMLRHPSRSRQLKGFLDGQLRPGKWRLVITEPKPGRGEIRENLTRDDCDAWAMARLKYRQVDGKKMTSAIAYGPNGERVSYKLSELGELQKEELEPTG